MSNLVPLDPLPGLFANRTINLLIGSGKAGKTVLMLSEIENYIQTGQMLGYSVQEGQTPMQCAIIARGGTLGEMHATIRDMKMLHCSNPVTLPITEWEDPGASSSSVEMYARLYRELSLAARQSIRLIFVEDFQSTVSEGDTTKAINKFYRELKHFMTDNDVTIVGIVNQAKAKAGERYPLLSDQTYGSIAWGVGASSLIGIEHRYLHIEEGLRPSMRKVTVQPAKSRAVQIHMDFTIDGRLERIDVDDTPEASRAFELLDATWSKEQAGKSFKRTDFKLWGMDLGITDRTVDRWIESRSSDQLGMLEKSSKGGPARSYRKPVMQ